MKLINISFLILSLNFLFSIGYSQPLSKSLGAVQSNFNIFSDSNDLEVLSQIIIKRAEFERKKYTNSDQNSSFGYGYGYGYESFHLEFMSRKDIVTLEKYHRKRKDKYYLISFYDTSNTMLFIRRIESDKVHKSRGTAGEKIDFFYSIDLQGIPILILDQAVEIDFVKVHLVRYPLQH